jgi:hypothetical protein
MEAMGRIAAGLRKEFPPELRMSSRQVFEQAWERACADMS